MLNHPVSWGAQEQQTMSHLDILRPSTILWFTGGGLSVTTLLILLVTVLAFVIFFFVYELISERRDNTE